MTGAITSTSPKLTNQDYAEFMAVVERSAGGTVLHFTARYWQQQAADHLQERMRFTPAAWRRAGNRGQAGGRSSDGLAGWIERRVSGGETSKLEDLDFHGLTALILGLQAYARQQGVAIEQGETQNPSLHQSPLHARRARVARGAGCILEGVRNAVLSNADFRPLHVTTLQAPALHPWNSESSSRVNRSNTVRITTLSWRTARRRSGGWPIPTGPVSP